LLAKLDCSRAITSKRTKGRSGSTRMRGGRTKRHGTLGGRKAVPLVRTFTVNGAGAPLAIATVAGTWHVALIGAPLQASEMVPVYPVPGVSCRRNCAVCPADTETVVEPVGAGPGVNAGLALPWTWTICGEFAASSVSVMVVVRTPGASGVKVTAIVQAELLGIAALQVGLEELKSLASAPAIATLEM